MWIVKRFFSRFVSPVRRGAKKNFHKNLAQYNKSTVPNSNTSESTNNIMNQNRNDQIARGGRGGLLSTFYESFIYGCGFFLSNRLLDQIFGPRHYDSITNDIPNSADNITNPQDNNINNSNNNNYGYSNEHFQNNDSNINDDDFQQDIGLDDDTFEF